MITACIFKSTFFKTTPKNTIIITDILFALVHANCGPPINIFHHYSFSSLGNPVSPFVSEKHCNTLYLTQLQ